MLSKKLDEQLEFETFVSAIMGKKMKIILFSQKKDYIL